MVTVTFRLPLQILVCAPVLAVLGRRDDDGFAQRAIDAIGTAWAARITGDEAPARIAVRREDSTIHGDPPSGGNGGALRLRRAADRDAEETEALGHWLILG